MSALFRRRAAGPAAMPTVTAAEAANLIEHAAVLVDVREPFEWNAGHAPDVRHIPLGQLPQRVPTLPTDKQIILVCRSGNRSAQATAILAAAGFNAANMAGGMAAWARAGLPVVTDSGAPGTVA
jgi:rhodanese-related sulfurtransferase